MITGALPAPRPLSLPAALQRWSPMVAIVLAALIQQALTALDCDVSWLITTAERMLDGARLYRDIEEVNPPASVLLYVSPVAIGALLGLKPEIVTVVLVTGLALLSLQHAARLLALPPSRSTPYIAAAVAFFLLVLPADLFAQREHVALIAGLPMLALLVARSRRSPVRRADGWSAGLAAGIMVAIKPHLALALILPALWLVIRQRSLAAVRTPEWVAAALLCAGYLCVVQFAFPDYTARMLPLLRLVYLPGRDNWSNLLAGPMVMIPVVAAILTLWLSRGRPSEAAIVGLLAAVGFAAAGLVQGKGYLNHGYPAVAAALIAITLELGRPGHARAFGSLCALLLALGGTYAYARVPQPYALRDAIVRVGPPQPRLIGISFDFALGHPLTRWVDGRWVGRRGSLWVTGNARQQLADAALPVAERRRYEAAEQADAAMLAADITRQRPDIILVDDTPGIQWIASHPPLAKAMRAYRPATRVGRITLWKPRPSR